MGYDFWCQGKSLIVHYCYGDDFDVMKIGDAYRMYISKNH